MARLNIQVVLLVALAAVVLSAPLTAASSRSHSFLRQQTYRRDFGRSGETGTMCVGSVAELLHQHEGRNRCAYDHKGGFRAVGCGYNLDDDKEQRRRELKEALLDYDRVYKGEQCLDDMQVSGLLTADADRALKRAARNVERLNEFCCPVRAVFADIQHTAGSVDEFPREDMDNVIERVASEDYKTAADELERTKWCSKGRHMSRCSDNLDLVERGCSK
ncbi:hypothetical protein R1flu_016058 [Riccia fluitans]|uniref:Uncharacterized protein n=1 Tax=Riccia fluitans TaxID=41844 RepID=A0ABD1YPK6_9MARC